MFSIRRLSVIAAVVLLSFLTACHEIHFEPRSASGEIDIYDHLFSVSIPSESRIVAAGDRGAIYFSQDGGDTWENVKFISDKAGFVDEGSGHAFVLALGESRLPEAIPLLSAQWHRTFDRNLRRAIALGMVSSRTDGALDFLFGLVSEGDRLAAAEAISALAVLRHDEKLRERTAAAVEKSCYRSDLRGTLRREFR